MTVTRDALDPGEDGSYPAWPRLADGSTDPVRMPTGVQPHRVRHTGRRVIIDVTPRHPDGTPIVPPSLPAEEE
jgi:hypothetical protein